MGDGLDSVHFPILIYHRLLKLLEQTLDRLRKSLFLILFLLILYLSQLVFDELFHVSLSVERVTSAPLSIKP